MLLLVRGEPIAQFFNVSSTQDKLLVAKVGTDHELPILRRRKLEPTRGEVKKDLINPACGFLHCQIITTTPGTSGSLKLERGNVTCSVDYKISQNSQTEHFAFAIHSGLLWFGEFLKADFCGVLKCVSGSPLCLIPDPLLRKIYTTEAIFDFVNITASFKDEEEAVFPMLTLDNGQIGLTADMKVESDSGIWKTNVQNEKLTSNVVFGLPWQQKSRKKYFR